MGVRLYKPCTPGTRFRSVSYFNELSKVKPQKSLTYGKKSSGGRNCRGVTTVRGRGGGHKRRARIIDFQRKLSLLDKSSFTVSKVASIEYDPNRSARIALILTHYFGSTEPDRSINKLEFDFYETPFKGFKNYIICPRSLKVGMNVISGNGEIPLEVGNAMPLEFIPLGSIVHNVELTLGKGGQVARAAGTSAKVIAREGNYISLKFPSKEVRLVHKKCYATFGQVGNGDHMNIKIGKAGRSRWLGRRPKVRGSAQNPNDHPHGGGEGRCPVGRVHPVSPWGKPALGVKTRKKKKK